MTRALLVALGLTAAAVPADPETRTGFLIPSSYDKVADTGDYSGHVVQVRFLRMVD